MHYRIAENIGVYYVYSVKCIYILQLSKSKAFLISFCDSLKRINYFVFTVFPNILENVCVLDRKITKLNYVSYK